MRRALLALALAAAACALTACGVRNSVDPVASAATKTQRAGGYKVAMSVTVSAAGRQIAMTGRGTFGHDQGELELSMDGLMGALGGLTGGSGSGLTMKTVYLTEDGDSVVYMNLGFLTSFLPGGKSWVRLDLEKASKAAGVDVNQLMGGAGQSPSDWLSLLQSQGDFAKVGDETLHGVETTHYHGTVDLRQVAEKSPVSDAMKRLLENGAPAEYPLDVWVDDQGYIRQYESTYDETRGGNAASTTTVEISDYGTQVDISAPPADEVFDATELATKGISSKLGGSTH
jgi:outer membrane lipoprotein-sorting protein